MNLMSGRAGDSCPLRTKPTHGSNHHAPRTARVFAHLNHIATAQG